ncbi:soluble lytic murein transglycosylase [Orenia metallireducens]|uniref:Soluble lytic murein transglycosylase n=1 Tax=Orenia metallireducens TaxID=1413210 RepID=A0A285HPC4_9FIRM|nr:transglycosylase SLT domain-containing protein [Orenia metallireducens]PRX27965.1 soluble lytic murein transglycosylase [Orenia metallireducens]SNY37592.1 soluble lytic murein transglycosylase [Orenia metallireducens]
MKYRLSYIILMFFIILSCSDDLYAYEHQVLENYIAYRIKYIHNIAYNSNITLSKDRVREYANSIVAWSNYYSKELDVVIDPLLITAIIETETNFVSRADYDQGESIGISSMRVDTAKWIAKNMNVDYNKWRMLDATDLGIRFTVYYLGLAYQQYDGEINKVIISYNQGFSSANNKDIDQLYNNYLFKVLGRYNYYKKRINSYGTSATKYFAYKFSQLE